MLPPAGLGVDIDLTSLKLVYERGVPKTPICFISIILIIASWEDF